MNKIIIKFNFRQYKMNKRDKQVRQKKKPQIITAQITRQECLN